MIQTNIVGNIGQNAKVELINGKKVANFTVAVNLNDNKVKWFNVSYWTESKILDYLKKGTLVYVTGEVGCFLSKTETGSNVARLEIKANKVLLLGSQKKDTDNNQAPPFTADDMPPYVEIDL